MLGWPCADKRSHDAIVLPHRTRDAHEQFEEFGGRLLSITGASKNYTEYMRITSKGQVTIPQWVRERYGFMPESDVEFVERDGMVTLAAAGTASKPDRADQLLEALRGAAGRSRDEMSTDEIMRLTRAYDDDE
jgi:bifunctional DNA-binding transcriptional regulator/antitoxin component of YhaV-PrlF toxin-antitoxin module